MRKATIFIVLAFVLVLCATPVYAIPPLPHAFYGDLTVNGSPAPTGISVEARGEGVMTGIEANPIVTEEVGKYGSADPSGAAKLIVQGDILDGTTITFYVEGVSTGQTAEWHSGETTELDLNLVSDVTAQKVVTVPAAQTGYVIDFSAEANTTITVNTIGEVTITVKKYASNPHPAAPLPASMLPRYIDIAVDAPAAVDWPMRVEQTYTDAEVASINESTLGMYYYKAADSAWHRCSDTGVDTVANTIWANMLEAELTGSPVAFGGSARAAAPAGGGGGGGAPTFTLSLTGLAVTPSLKMNNQGVVQSACCLTTADGKLILDIAKDTKLLDSAGYRLASLSAALEPSPPAPAAEEVIITAYDLGPDGATFSLATTLTIKYAPEGLPRNIAEEDLYIGYWDGSKWLALETTVNTRTDTASCPISHFTTFAVIGAVTPPAPAAFSVSKLSIQPAEVQPKEAVTVTLSVANTGGTEGSYSVVLKINGVKEAEKSVTVAPGSSKSVSFSVTKEDAGTYSVVVDGLSSSFTVAAAAPPAPAPPPAPPAKPPINWPVVGGIIAAVVVVGLLIFFLVRRRAY